MMWRRTFIVHKSELGRENNKINQQGKKLLRIKGPINFITLITFYYTTPYNLISLITGNETFTCNDSAQCAMCNVVYDNVTQHLKLQHRCNLCDCIYISHFLVHILASGLLLPQSSHLSYQPDLGANKYKLNTNTVMY